MSALLVYLPKEGVPYGRVYMQAYFGCVHLQLKVRRCKKNSSSSWKLMIILSCLGSMLVGISGYTISCVLLMIYVLAGVPFVIYVFTGIPGCTDDVDSGNHHSTSWSFTTTSSLSQGISGYTISCVLLMIYVLAGVPFVIYVLTGIPGCTDDVDSGNHHSTSWSSTTTSSLSQGNNENLHVFFCVRSNRFDEGLSGPQWQIKLHEESSGPCWEVRSRVVALTLIALKKWNICRQNAFLLCLGWYYEIYSYNAVFHWNFNKEEC